MFKFRIILFAAIVISSTKSFAQLSYTSPSTLGGTSGNDVLQSTITGPGGSAGNTVMANQWFLRNGNGTDWFTVNVVEGISVDVSYLTAQTARTWWKRDPRNQIHSWGSGTTTYMSVSPDAQLQIGTVNDGLNKLVRIPGTYNFEGVNLNMGLNGNGALEFVTHNNATNSGGVRLYSTDGANLQFQTASPVSSYGALSYATKMVLTNDGRVGIGTTTTNGYKLAVEGTIGAREINVNTSTWSDYVFDADYKLPSLETVERFIKQHHHLPEVPNAKEVEEKGVNVGEMNALLLKKIEELTLYVIDLKKDNIEMKKEISELKSKK